MAPRDRQWWGLRSDSRGQSPSSSHRRPHSLQNRSWGLGVTRWGGASLEAKTLGQPGAQDRILAQGTWAGVWAQNLSLQVGVSVVYKGQRTEPGLPGTVTVTGLCSALPWGPTEKRGSAPQTAGIRIRCPSPLLCSSASVLGPGGRSRSLELCTLGSQPEDFRACIPLAWQTVFKFPKVAALCRT